MTRSGKPLAFRIRSLNNQIKRLFEKSAIEKNDANLTGMQYAVLGHVSNHIHEDIFQRDIEKEFNIRRSTASSMLQSLENEGYIKRVSFPDDARLKKIIATEKALRLDEKAKKDVKRLQEKLTQNISDEDLEHFYRVLNQISRNAND